MYKDFEQMILKKLEPYKDRNILIYGVNWGGIYLKWLIERTYHKPVKGLIDKHRTSPTSTILHLMSLYYVYDPDDIIINTVPVGIKDAVEAVGDSWRNFSYNEDQVLDLWHKVYEDDGEYADEKYPELTYFDWLEFQYKLDLNAIVRKEDVSGEGAHGYYPIEVCPIRDIMDDYQISNLDAVIDFGSGKGSGMIVLRACGFQNVGGIEYTRALYDDCVNNFKKLNWNYSELSIGNENDFNSEFLLWNGDARELKYELDAYNWFYFFNPFGRDVFRTVFHNICDSLERKPRKTYIIYGEPMGHEIIMASNRFRYKKYKKDYYNCVMWFYVYETME